MTDDRPELPPGRRTEVDGIVGRVTRWAVDRPDVVGLLLAGSYARDAARPDSDVDLILLTTDELSYADNSWADQVALGELTRVRSWGAVTERRFRTGSGLAVEINIGAPDWAATDPVDSGTRRVVSDGVRRLYDPTGALDRLIRACAAGAADDHGHP
jgi:hypothetical protein